jgi:uncharacterized protein
LRVAERIFVGLTAGIASSRISRRMFVTGSAVFLFGRDLAAQSRARLVLATAGQGSGFLAFGQALAAIVPKHSSLDIDIRDTRGSNENVELVDRGEVALACLNMGPGFDAWNGNPPFAGKPLRGMRALVPMYETPFHTIAARELGITSLADLNGKRVGVGPSGGPSEVFFKGVASALGVQATLITGTPSELGMMLLRKQIDAFWYGSGLPSPPFVEVAQKIDAAVIGFTPKEAAAFRQLFPYFAPFEIAANTYRGQASPLASVAVWNFLVANSGLPSDTAYALTGTLISHAGEVQHSFAAAASMNLKNLGANTFMPFHVGAVRYYRENGLQLAKALASE